MSSVAVVFSADTEHGAALCRGLHDRDWTVVGGSASLSPDFLHAVPMDPRSIQSLQVAAETVAQAVGTVDLLIYNFAVSPERAPSAETDFTAVLRAFDTIALGAIRYVEAFLPLMESGQKRLCFVTHACGSIDGGDSSGGIGNGMATTALHMACKNLFNNLRSDGYTFRLCMPDAADPDASADADISFFTSDREDEDRLVIVDSHSREWPF